MKITRIHRGDKSNSSISTKNAAAYLGIALCLNLTVSCSTSSSKTDTERVDIPTVTFEPLGTDQTFTDAFSKVKFLQLELTKDCIIGEVVKVEDADGTLIILSNDHEIFAFDKETGKFLRKIGSIGDSPEEYLSITDMYYNEKDGTINILDRFKSSVISYNINGQFLENRHIDAPIYNANSVAVTTDGYIMLSNSISNIKPASEYAYTIIDPKGRDSNIDSFAPIYVDGYVTNFASRPMSSIKERITFLKFLNDTLFFMENGKVKPLYKLSMKKQMPRKEIVAQMGPFKASQLAKMSFTGEYISGFNKLFETKHYLVLAPWVEEDGYFWIDKGAENGVRIPKSDDVNLNIDMIIEGRNIANLIGSNETELTSSFTAFIGKEMFLEEFAEHPEIEPFSPDLKPFWESVDPDGNPCLIIYEH